jgi:MoaA/NifB/PqqE/SkfB family radical SAM enzyme
LNKHKSIRKKDQHYDIWLQWNVTSQCNFDCLYCFGKTPVSKADINAINIDKLVNTLNKTNKVFRIGFTGGEPFLIPNITEACKELTGNHYVSFNTNLILPEVKEFAEKINPERVLNMHSSLHLEELKKKNLIDTFVGNYKLLENSGFNIYAEAVAWPGTGDVVESHRKLMTSLAIEYSYAPYIGNNKVLDYPEIYSDHELELFSLSRDMLEWFGQKGAKCNAAFNAGVVFSNGDIYPCFQIKKKLGNIYEEINFNSELTVCPAKRCACPLNKYDDYLFNKAAIAED